MDLSNNPYGELDLGELAQACGERAGELQARAWRNEDERNALREATAELLAAVARQLATGVAAPQAARLLDASELLEITANNVCHQPLHTAAHVGFGGGTRHTWIDDFVPGDEPAPHA